MPELIQFEADFAGISKAIRMVSKEANAEMRKALRDAAKVIAMKTRTKVPSGMKAAATGISWGYWSLSGAYIKAGGKGTTGGGAKKSWVGALEGGNSGAKPFKHPVFPKAGTPRNTWTWSQPQPPQPILHRTFEEMRPELLAASEAAIDRALARTGLRGY